MRQKDLVDLQPYCKELIQKQDYNLAFLTYWAAYEATIKSGCTKALVYRGLDYAASRKFVDSLDWKYLMSCLRVCCGYDLGYYPEFAFIYELGKLKPLRNGLVHGGLFDPQNKIIDYTNFLKEYFDFIPDIWHSVKVYLNSYNTVSLRDPYLDPIHFSEKPSMYRDAHQMLSKELSKFPEVISNQCATINPNPLSWDLIMMKCRGRSATNDNLADIGDAC